jgi:uncharacterized protein (DUF1330 family)
MGAKGYVILTEAIKDPEGMKAYGQAARTAMGGATILAVGAPKVIEGGWHGDQTVLLEFESVEAARASGSRRLQRRHHRRLLIGRYSLNEMACLGH